MVEKTLMKVNVTFIITFQTVVKQIFILSNLKYQIVLLLLYLENILNLQQFKISFGEISRAVFVTYKLLSNICK